MSKVQQMALRFALAMALAVAGIGIGISSASAGVCYWVFCGRVTNTGWSVRSVQVTETWPASAGHIRQVLPGYSSTYKDTDGFYAPPGYVTRNTGGTVYAAGWHKINDLQHVYLVISYR